MITLTMQTNGTAVVASRTRATATPSIDGRGRWFAHEPAQVCPSTYAMDMKHTDWRPREVSM